jgi:hypothetical protein
MRTSYPFSALLCLSTGAKADIRVGAVIGGLLLIVLGVLLAKVFTSPSPVKRQRRSENAVDATPAPELVVGGMV